MSNGTNASGAFELQFNSEKAFQLFGKTYGRCYANFEGKGQMAAPLPYGPLAYKVNFTANCGCDTVVGKFNKAYAKTYGQTPLEVPVHDFVSSTRAMLEGGTGDYAITLLSCSLPGVAASMALRSSPLDQSRLWYGDQAAAPFNSTDPDGLFSIIVGTTEIPVGLQNELDTYKSYLSQMHAIAANYVANQAQGNASLKWDPTTWAEAFNHLPLMGKSAFAQQSFNQTIAGITIPTAFLELILSAVVDDPSTLTKFSQFLQAQGSEVGAHYKGTQETYRYGANCIIIEAVQVGNDVELQVMLKSHLLTFDSSNYKVTTLCGSFEKTNVNFDYQVGIWTFAPEGLTDPTTLQDFKQFLASTNQANINQDKNFFGGSGIKTTGSSSKNPNLWTASVRSGQSAPGHPSVQSIAAVPSSRWPSEVAPHPKTT